MVWDWWGGGGCILIVLIGLEGVHNTGSCVRASVCTYLGRPFLVVVFLGIRSIPTKTDVLYQAETLRSGILPFNMYSS